MTDAVRDEDGALIDLIDGMADFKAQSQAQQMAIMDAWTLGRAIGNGGGKPQLDMF